MRVITGITPERLRQIDPEGVRAYLVYLGWKLLEYPDKRVWVYAPPNDIESSLPVPATRSLNDYVALIDRVVATLASVEECAYEDVLQLLCNHSILKLRAVDQQTTVRGTLPLLSAELLIKKAQDLIAYSTCAETGPPQKHYVRSIRKAREHADKYELGQTEPGSFIINIITPIRPITESESMRLTDIEPLEHRVLRRIIHGAEIVQQAERFSDANMIAENFGSGFNANMCDIVADTIEQTSLDALSFCALGIDKAHNVDRLPDVLLTRDCIPQLEKASVILKDAPVDEMVSIVGYITVLRNEDTPEPDKQRHVQITWSGKGINVHLTLTDNDYAIACDSHRDHSHVSVDGILHHEKRKYYLYDYRNFRIYGDSQGSLF